MTTTYPADGETRDDERSQDGSADAVWDLVDRSRTGDTQAFSALYRRHVSDVFGYILSRTNDRNLAEEFTSETFLRAFRRIDSVTYRGHSFLSWICTIARNVVIDDLKSARRRREVALPDGFDWPADQTDPAHEIFARMTAAELRRGMAELTRDQRLCLTLRFFEYRSVSEVARAMKRSEVSVRALQLRGVRKLGEVLEASMAVMSDA